MGKNFSVYLDLVRFLAACEVILFHSNRRSLAAFHVPLADWGHEAVIVFFVLSGFVIPYVTAARENDPVAYSASRISRIYSLALPTVLLTPILDGIGRSLNLAAYDGSPFDWWIVRMLGSLTFLNDTWFLSIQSFSNVPYWSLNYEVWYYVLFGIWAFGGRHRKPLLAAVCLLIGPKVLLLAPIWLLGTVLFHWKRLQRWPEWLGWSVAAATSVAIALFLVNRLSLTIGNWIQPLVGARGHELLGYSKWFLGDWVLGVIVLFHFASIRALEPRLAFLSRSWVEKPIRGLASHTFTLYLLHQPLLFFWAAVFSGSPTDPRFYLSTLACTLASLFALGFVFERQRGGLRTNVLRLLRRRWPGPNPSTR